MISKVDAVNHGTTNCTLLVSVPFGSSSGRKFSINGIDIIGVTAPRHANHRITEYPATIESEYSDAGFHLIPTAAPI